MARDEKLIARMKQSPRNIRFSEVDRFLKRQGFEARQRGSSHVIYKREDGTRLGVVKPHGGGDDAVDPAAIAKILDTLEL